MSGVDDDHARSGRDRQQVVDIELTDDLDPDVGDGVPADQGGGRDRRPVVPAVRGAAHQDLDREQLPLPRIDRAGRPPAGHPRSSTVRSRKWVAQLMHGS